MNNDSLGGVKLNHKGRGRIISKLLLFAALLALPVLLACGGEDATVAPTDTPLPQPTVADTPEPMASSEPMATPEATPTPVPEPTQAPSKIISPLVLDGPDTALSELSESERTCLEDDDDDTASLIRALGAPGTAGREGQAKLIGCLEDETLARVFLAGFVGDSGPLSVETSICVRSAFSEIDPRAVMTAGIEGNPGAAMAGSMAGFSVTLACLNDEEWEAAAPRLGMAPGEREGMQCVLEELGGPSEMAAAMKAANEDDFTVLAQALMDCGLDTGPLPGQAPAANETKASRLAPLVLDTPEAMATEFSASELSCLAEVAGPEGLLRILNGKGKVTPEEHVEVVGCLEDETLFQLFLAELVEGSTVPLSEETSICIRRGFRAIDVRSVMVDASKGDGTVDALYLSGYFVTLGCLNEEEWEAIAQRMDMAADARESMQCLLEEMGGPQAVAAGLAAYWEGAGRTFFTAALDCGLEF